MFSLWLLWSLFRGMCCEYVREWGAKHQDYFSISFSPPCQKMNIDAKVLESFINPPSCSRPVKENLIAPHGE